MPKLEKIEKEMQRTREKIADWQNKLKLLEVQRTEQENLEIVQIVRAIPMSRAELVEFLKNAARPARPVSREKTVPSKSAEMPNQNQEAKEHE